MAPITDELAKRADDTESHLYKCARQNISGTDLATVLQQYRLACESLIFTDFGFAIANNIESKLWDAHTKVNNVFRKELRHARRNKEENDHVVEFRKLGKNYLVFIKSSQRFYRHYVLNLDAHCNGIPELRRIAQTWKDDAKPPISNRIPSSMKSRVLLSCHKALIQLGDLSRYRETELVAKDKERNWGPAKGYYDLAAEIYPDSGEPHNQQAVIAREDGNHFRCVYHLYRSLSTTEPHPKAKDNLELEFKRIVSAWQKGELINNHRSAEGNTAGKALIAWFVRLHSMCYNGQEFAQHDELENEVLSHLAIELKERPLDGVLQKMVVINIAAEYFATVQLKESQPPEHITRTYFYYLRLNVKTFFTLLQILQPELERLTEGDDVTNRNGDRDPQLSDKITAVARRILPGLRLYSMWFVRFWHVLEAYVADTLTKVEVQELWKAYAETLTLLASTFPAQELPQDQYMLEEDVDSVGFQPLICDETHKIWYNEDGLLKKKASDLGRNHPNVEMLMRIRDFLIDGLQLTQNAEAPLDLDGLRFIYREAGLPSQLLASPNNRPDGSPTVPAAQPSDLALFPPKGPVPDDQKSFSVAHSDSASTALAKDSAMNRMVDDLVGPDDGLEALPEEDENIPPTPPEQTFEDTTMVNDTSYGIGPLTISDIVNVVHNYGKPVGSPQTPVFTPMNRAASSSSIRQPANLPSLPDGQSNGASIWNRNYNGTPGPSSPLIGSGKGARSSPLNAHSSSGHARADSTHSIGSSHWTVPTATPVQQPVAGGLGSGAVWGNPSASLYGSIYGNQYNNRNGTDVNLMSPILFGQETWSSSLEKGHSSYGRTPPNGQGG